MNELKKAIKENENVKLEKLIKENPELINKVIDEFGTTALYFACSKNNIKAVELILANCPHINLEKSLWGTKILKKIMKNGKISFKNVDWLFDYFKKFPLCFGETPLFVSVLKRNLEISKLLLENGANVNALNNIKDFKPRKQSYTWIFDSPMDRSLLDFPVYLLEIAVANNDLEMVKLLCTQNQLIEINHLKKAIILSIEKQRLEATECLIKIPVFTQISFNLSLFFSAINNSISIRLLDYPKKQKRWLRIAKKVKSGQIDDAEMIRKFLNYFYVNLVHIQRYLSRILKPPIIEDWYIDLLLICGMTKKVKRVMSREDIIMKFDNDKKNELLRQIIRRSSKTLELLIEYKVEINKVFWVDIYNLDVTSNSDNVDEEFYNYWNDEDFVTPLRIALDNKDFNMTKLLLENNALICDKHNVLSKLATNGFISILEKMLNQNERMLEEELEKNPYFVNYILSLGHIHFADQILLKKPELKSIIFDKANVDRLMDIASKSGSIDLFEWLIRKGIKNFDESKTILHLASSHNHPKFVELLLNLGYDPNKKDIHNETPLHCVLLRIENGDDYFDVIKLLVDSGANINIEIIDYKGLPSNYDNFGTSQLYPLAKSGEIIHPLQLLVYANKLRIIKYLGSRIQSQVNSLNSFLHTPLTYATIIGNVDMIEYLISLGANPFFVNDDGLSLVHFAVKSQNILALKLLVEKYSLDVNLKDKRGKTPLCHLVKETLQIRDVECYYNKKKILLYLAKAKAQMNLCDIKRKTPLDYAIKENNYYNSQKKIASLLMRNGATQFNIDKIDNTLIVDLFDEFFEHTSCTIFKSLLNFSNNFNTFKFKLKSTTEKLTKIVSFVNYWRIYPNTNPTYISKINHFFKKLQLATPKLKEHPYYSKLTSHNIVIWTYFDNFIFENFFLLTGICKKLNEDCEQCIYLKELFKLIYSHLGDESLWCIK